MLLIMTDKVDISIVYQIYKTHIRRVKVSRSISGYCDWSVDHLEPNVDWLITRI